MQNESTTRTRAHESRAAIERLYIIMRHLFIRGSYKPLGVSGASLIHSLLTLRPEIYGAIADPEHVELDGLLYIIDRLPRGIEECRFIKLIAKEGLEGGHFPVIEPSKRRRNCYRIDEEQMYIELTRGRSDIYDILTHLTFMYVEAEKIKRHSLDNKGNKLRAWVKLEEIVEKESQQEPFNKEIANTYLSTILGRTYAETEQACIMFEKSPGRSSLYHFTYWLGKLAIEEEKEGKDREISFSPTLRERIGHHVHGERWANTIQNYLLERQLIRRPIHIISANLHSVMNAIYALPALKKASGGGTLEAVAQALSQPENQDLRDTVKQYALKNGLHEIKDTSGTNLTVQIIDTAHVDFGSLPDEVAADQGKMAKEKPIVLVMDYAFGEQAFETMDELLKPLGREGQNYPLDIGSVSIMGKAGILRGGKGDIMIPTSHVFEGTTDNYPIENDFHKEDFEGHGLQVFEGAMITVLGTSLQNKDILNYFMGSSWGAVGLEMEGAHYQKAIQAASRIRKSVSGAITVRYAYYASDNPLLTGSTLASGGLGLEGVKPTYLITTKILGKIFG